MATKCTWLFNGGISTVSTSGKVWGFSETWYSGLTGDPLLAAMDNVSRFRARILAKDCQIVGYRISQDNGRAFVIKRTFAGPRGNDFSNIPVDSALCRATVAGSAAIKRFWLHDLPDDWVVQNDVAGNVLQQVQQAAAAYSVFGFSVRYINQAAASADILSIDATGLVTTVQDFATAGGNVVELLHVRDVNNRPIRGQYVVSAVTDSKHFTLAHWGGSTVGRRGKVRAVQYLFGSAIIDPNTCVIGAGSRKVGRPFFQLRGRVPNRR